MSKNKNVNGDGHFGVYQEYAKNLRTWFVAYGIGGPALFLTQSDLSTRLADSGLARTVVALFCSGTAFQILLSLINKWCQWTLYRGETAKHRMNTRAYEFWREVSNMPSIDWICDIGSLICFTIATVILIIVFIP